MGHTPRQDVLAGLTVGIVALPLALAFGITSGVGATAGLVTAVVAGTVAALFGGSPVQVSGPTGAMTVVLVPIVAQFGTRGVVVVGLMAGLILVLMALAGAGRYVRYIPLPVIEGFTLGIAVIIGLQQIPAALGVPADGEQVVVVAGRAVAAWVQAPQLAPVLLALAVAAMILLVRVRPAIPVALIAVAAATIVAVTAHIQVTQVGALPTSLPAPRLPEASWADLRTLAAPAFAVAALAALESLLSATVADAMSVSDRHDPDRELFGQGLANLASPLFGGLPATAAIARTAVNVRTGARSRLAAVVHAAALLAVVLALGGVVALVPIAALAGVLLATAIRMVETHTIRRLVRSGRSDALVLTLTFVATVALDLATAVILGMLTAGALALRHLAMTSQLHETTLEDAIREDGTAGPGTLGRTDSGGENSSSGGDSTSPGDLEHTLLDANIVAYRLDGPLFFGAAHAALMALAQVDQVKVVILRLSRLSTLDATGAAVLTETIHDLRGRGVTVLLSGMQPQHERPLRATGVLDELLAQRHVFAHTPTAIAHARRHVARDHHHPE
ncbi:MAG: SulP family inorganic anion transporter [Phycicoccus sp.]|nr:SulP family inorganic anion transporter [Phycicoccus sp.]